MKQLVDRRGVLASVATLALLIAGWAFLGDASVRAQLSPSTLQRPIVRWFGPFAITPNDTARFNYTNFGVDPVLVEWAFSNALTGELVCHNFGMPSRVEAHKGAIWDFSQTIDPTTMMEMQHCEGGMLGSAVGSNETYFDVTNRHQMVAWIFIKHTTPLGEQRAVDLPTVEIFDSMVMQPPPAGDVESPIRSMTFGRTIEVIHANPTAPADLLPVRMATQPGQ